MALILPNPSSSKLCEQCGKPAKYCCPKCVTRSCSLSCVQLHKKILDCDGERDKSAFVKVKEFTDIDLLNDYRLLEETSRYIDSVCRSKRIKHAYYQPYLPQWLHRLKMECKFRGINLRLLPSTFTKRKQNSTRYLYAEKNIVWKMEWHFPQWNVVKIVNRVPENAPLGEFLKSLLKDGENFLEVYERAEASDMKFLLQSSLPESHKKFGYYELDASKPLKLVLKGRTILEYPIIFVVLNDHIHGYTILNPDTNEDEIEKEVEKDFKPILVDKRDFVEEKEDIEIMEPKKISKFFDF